MFRVGFDGEGAACLAREGRLEYRGEPAYRRESDIIYRLLLFSYFFFYLCRFLRKVSFPARWQNVLDTTSVRKSNN